MAATGLWDVIRRRWQVLALSVEVGVGVALLATMAADSSRPLRDVLLGLVAGCAFGLTLLSPVDHSIRRRAAAPVRRRRGARRVAVGCQRVHQPVFVVFPSTPWPDPELIERPRPTFAPPPG